MQKLAEYIVRPTRRTYDPNSELGPSLFTVNQKYYCSRTDFEVRNRRYKMLKCSLFHHNVEDGVCHPLIVFCHGNSGNRTYSYEIVSRMLQEQISVLTFDFAGCGLSEGNYVFQGFFEQFDIEDVLEYACDRFRFIDPEKIGIWGRSMGAIAALLFASHNSSASLIIVDSPFKDFSDILNEYITRFKIIPNIFAKYISSKLRTNILHTCGFDFEQLKPIETIATCRTPALFHHTKNDRIVPNYHSKDLFEAYPAEKEYLETEGGHNSERQEEYYDAVMKFIHKIFSRKRSADTSLMRISTLQPRKNPGEQDCTEIFEYELEKQNGKKSKKASYDSHEPLRMSNFQPIINPGEKDSVEVIDGEVAEKENNAVLPKSLGDRDMRNSTLQPCKNLGEQDCIEIADHELDQEDEIKEEEEEENNSDVSFDKEQIEKKLEAAEDIDEMMNREIEHESEILLKQFTEEDYSFFEKSSRHINHGGPIEEEEMQQLHLQIEQIQEQEEEERAIEQDQNQSSFSEGSQYARIESEDLSHDLSKALSEPDRVATLKPWKVVRRTSANNSFFKGQ